MSISIHNLNQSCASGLLLFFMPLSIMSLAAHGEIVQQKKVPGHCLDTLATSQPSPLCWSFHTCHWLTLPLKVTTEKVQMLTQSCHFTYMPKPNKNTWEHPDPDILTGLCSLPSATVFWVKRFSILSWGPHLSSRGKMKASGSPKREEKHGSWEESPFERWTDDLLLLLNDSTSLDNFSNNMHFTNSLYITGINTQSYVDQLWW